MQQSNSNGGYGRTILHVKYPKEKSRGMNDEWAEYYIVDQDVVRWYLWYVKYTWPKYHGKGAVFRQWRHGEPHNQPLTARYFYYKHYRLVARLLGKANWRDFIGHSCCRTAASIFAANGGSLQQLMVWGKWKSPKVAIGYMNDSNTTKLANAELLDLNNNKLSKSTLTTMEIDTNALQDVTANYQNYNNHNHKSNTKNKYSGHKRSRNETDLDTKKEVFKKPKKKKRKLSKKKMKKFISKMMDLMEALQIDTDDDDDEQSDIEL